MDKEGGCETCANANERVRRDKPGAPLPHGDAEGRSISSAALTCVSPA